MDNNLEELTGEYLLVKYAERFSAQAVKAAQSRLESHRKN
jgi:hypothetical protein